MRSIPLLIALPFALAAAAPADELRMPDGVKVHYTVEGKGEPLVLIHGLAASIDLNWRLPGIVDRLARTRRVIAIDLRGHGGSDKPEEGYGEALVEDVVRILDALEVERADLAGYSLGGMVSMKLAARHPGRVRSIALCGMGWLREGSWLQRSFRLLPRVGGAPVACVREIPELALSEEELRAIACPVTVIVGENDPIRRLYVEPLRKVRPDWPVHLVPRAGHLTCVVSGEFRRLLEETVARPTSAATRRE